MILETARREALQHVAGQVAMSTHPTLFETTPVSFLDVITIPYNGLNYSLRKMTISEGVDSPFRGIGYVLAISGAGGVIQKSWMLYIKNPVNGIVNRRATAGVIRWMIDAPYNDTPSHTVDALNYVTAY